MGFVKRSRKGLSVKNNKARTRMPPARVNVQSGSLIFKTLPRSAAF